MLFCPPLLRLWHGSMFLSGMKESGPKVAEREVGWRWLSSVQGALTGHRSQEEEGSGGYIVT